MLKNIVKSYNQNIIKTYGWTDLCFVRGSGVKVWDINDKEYLDFLSGISVNNIGYSHPKWVKAVQEQLNKIVHTSNLFYIEPQAKLAEKIINNSIDGKCFFCNSGAEANEAAIKLARKYAKEKFGADRTEIITMEQSFHGRTLAALSATGQKKYQTGFDPLVQGFSYVPFNNINAIKQKINKNTCAVMLELIQAEGGINVADKEYINEVYRLCKENEILLILDEVQTGIGRCGEMFAFKLYDIEPDIFTLAKALGGGIPIGAMIAKNGIAEAFNPGTHASTFGGNHLACTSASTVIDIIIEDDLLSNAKNMGDYLVDSLNDLKNKYSFIKDIRGKGLLIGMEIAFSAGDIINKCFEEGLILNCIQNSVIRFAPPLIIKKSDVDSMINKLESVLKNVDF